MKKKLTKIEFGFENCEACTLPIKAVPYFYLSNFQKEISHRWFSESEPADDLSVEIFCNKAHFIIDYELARKVKTNFMFSDDENWDKENLAERFLNWTNLSSITLYYDDDSNDFYWLAYDEVSPDEFWNTANRFQTTKVVQDTPLEIGINKAFLNQELV